MRGAGTVSFRIQRANKPPHQEYGNQNRRTRNGEYKKIAERGHYGPYRKRKESDHNIEGAAYPAEKHSVGFGCNFEESALDTDKHSAGSDTTEYEYTYESP